SSRRYDRPDGHIKPPERTQIWIKLGGKVSCQPLRRIVVLPNANGIADQLSCFRRGASVFTKS
ncbi:hypothetical protein ACQR02_33065, partial [Bradyrhizobium sp. HKCCYLS1049]